jgi:hypothetical protein
VEMAGSGQLFLGQLSCISNGADVEGRRIALTTPPPPL